MKGTGPSIQWLTHRLAGTPGDFLKKPFMKSNNTLKGQIDTSAVISDLLFDISGDYLDKSKADYFRPQESPENQNYLNLVLITCYLLHDSWFYAKKDFTSLIHHLFENKLKPLAKLVSANLFVNDPERREELARICLDTLGLIPEGETEITALDRLTTLDSIERVRLIEQTRIAQEKARKLREEIARREAEEAASKMSRE